MLNLFPPGYWIILVLAALARFITGQLISNRIIKLRGSNSKQLTKTVSSVQFIWFMRFSGIAHLILVAGLALMFYLTYQYIVPINDYSSDFLGLVYAIGYLLIAIELIIALMSILTSLYLIYKT